jgi:predicted kinase
MKKTEPEVIMTIGLPGSGKSTWAKMMVRKNPFKYKRVNKDDLRAMLDDSQWSRDNEDSILEVRDLLVLRHLRDGYNVIIDDTNLAPKHRLKIEQLVKDEFKLSFKYFLDTPLETCIKNDLNRLNSVGESVIRKMYNQYLKPKPEVIQKNFDLENAIICDLDGTLCHLNGRNPYDASTCDMDGLNVVVAELLLGRKVIFMSGREDKYRDKTELFLKKHDIQYEALYMRATGDTRKDCIIKKELFDNNVRGKYNIDFVLDDRNQVVDMWRQIGLTCLQVAPGDF